MYLKDDLCECSDDIGKCSAERDGVGDGVQSEVACFVGFRLEDDKGKTAINNEESGFTLSRMRGVMMILSSTVRAAMKKATRLRSSFHP